ncbi:Protein CBR-SRB-11, partial [Caenorhabditis briggsae]
NCTTQFLQAYNPIFRTSSFYQILVSGLSTFPLAYFLIFKLWPSSFHGNLKAIFVGYFVSLILFSIFYTVTATIQSLNPFIAHTNCDLLVPPFYHKILLSTISFLITLSTSFPFFITFERYFAIKFLEKYEQFIVILGPLLVNVNIIINFCIVFNIFQDEEFSEPSVSFSVNPPDAAQKMFTFYTILFILNIFDILLNFRLIFRNFQLKKALSNASLSVKYQLEEVYQSTKFSIFVIFVHIILFGIYVFLVVFFRYFGNLIVSDPYNLFGIRTFSSTMIPTYHLAIGIFSIYFFKKLKSQNLQTTTIQMSSTGTSGAKNYEKAIFEIWNTVEFA